MEQFWSGEFVSNMYVFLGFAMVKGRICASIPIDINETKESTVLLTYNGLYRNNQQSKLKISYSNTLDGVGTQDGICSFKGISFLTNQTVNFIINHMSDDEISGKYVSQNPIDMGTFKLQKNNALSLMLPA